MKLAKKSKLTTTFIAWGLAVCLLLGIAPVITPMTTSAADAATLAATINNYTIANGGNLSASVEGNTVIVTGTKTGATTALSLNIDGGVTVVWRATLTGTVPGVATYLLRLEGGTGGTGGIAGIFKMESGEISAKDCYMAINKGGTINMVISGGTISATTDSSSDMCLAINSEYGGGKITISGGTVMVNGGIYLGSNHSTAIRLGSGGAEVSGNGKVLALGDDNYAFFYPDTTLGSNVDVDVTGGLVFGHGNIVDGTADNITLTNTSGTVVVWNKPIDPPTYTQGTDDDLTFFPIDTTNKAVWGRQNGKSGIIYGTNEFFEIDGVTVIATPTAPRNFTATQGDGQVALSWIAPADNGGDPITKYEVSKDNGVNWENVTSGTSYTFTGLTNGTTYTFKVRAENSVGKGAEATTTATPTATNTINNPPDMNIPPTITTDSLPNGTAGFYYSQQLSATGTIPITWTLISGSLPNGLSLSGNAIMGTPITAGTFSFTVRAQNSAGSDTKVLSIYIGGGSGGGGGTIYYTVTFDTDGGSTIKSQSVARNGKVTKPADPVKDGFTFAGWYSDKKLAKEYDFNKSVTGNITIYAKWTENAIPPAEWQNPFEDVNKGDWFYSYVEYVYTHGLMVGTSTSPMLFSPNMPLTRGMIVTILYRLNGSPDVSGMANPFNDVAEGKWYTDAVKWTAANGVVVGYGNDKFGPYDNITRQDLAVILVRYADFAGIELPAAREYQSFDDNADVAGYAKDAVEKCYRAGIIYGKPGNIFDPQGKATRAEAAAMLMRLLIKI